MSAETPPRAWGRQGACKKGRPRRRNTPTGVGKTAKAQTARLPSQKHPHGRGEDIFAPFRASNRKETPPRAWGRPLRQIAIIANARNTPTGVGKTTHDRSCPPCGQKHPHGRGEDLGPPPRVSITPETPPRAWGRPVGKQAERAGAGNTPTGVGKTAGRPVHDHGGQKHPHGRGEDSMRRLRPSTVMETPPRAWGRQAPEILGAPGRRNTPTGVGKTSHLQDGKSLGWKHPHGRGEDYGYSQQKGEWTETPPRAWGRPILIIGLISFLRNTPTGVGKTA